MEWLAIVYLVGIFVSVWAVWPIGREAGAKVWVLLVAGTLWPCILLFAVVAGVAGAVAASWGQR